MSDNCQDFFTNNTDITGIGVRIAFYLQVNLLLLLGIISKSSEDVTASFWTLTFMSLGLLIAAMSAAANNQMSFFNAVQVENLVWFANIAQIVIFATSIPASKPKKRDSILDFFFVINLWLSSALTIYLWVNAPQFDSEPECEALMRFYFMFWKISISFRKIRVVAIVLYLIMIFFVFISSIISTQGIFTILFGNKFSLWKALQARRRRRKPYLTSPHWLIWTVGWVLGLLYAIPPLELFLRQHSQPGGDVDAQWSFGQILAVVSVIPSVVAILVPIWDKLAEGVSDSDSDSDSDTSETSSDGASISTLEAERLFGAAAERSNQRGVPLANALAEIIAEEARNEVYGNNRRPGAREHADLEDATHEAALAEIIASGLVPMLEQYAQRSDNGDTKEDKQETETGVVACLEMSQSRESKHERVSDQDSEGGTDPKQEDPSARRVEGGLGDAADNEVSKE